MSSAKKILPESYCYYFVSINRPLREPFLDIDILKDATKDYRINIDGGEFNIVSSDDTHAFLYKFKNSKQASKATQEDFFSWRRRRYPPVKYFV